MNTPQAKILIVDDELDVLDALTRSLRSEFDVQVSTSPKDALKLLKEESFAVVLSDQKMPEMSGVEFLAKVARLQPLATRLILTAHTETQSILDAINKAGIYRYIVKPWDNIELISTLQQATEYHDLRKENETLLDELKEKSEKLADLNDSLEKEITKRTRELKVANEKLSELAMTDPLTRLMNRRAFFERFDVELERSKRYRHEFSVAMLDIDHFKSFNDMEGHPLGDEALKKMAVVFRGNIRKTDFISRYGGEEFCLLMPETPAAAAREICERLRAAVEATIFQGKTEAAYLTLSVGVSAYPDDGDTRDTLVKAADEALYEAKRAGRNRVVSHQDEVPFFLG